MAQIINKTKECGANPNRLLLRKNITHLFIHRISLANYDPANPNPVKDEFLDGVGLADRFKATEALGTAKQVPYHFLATKNNPTYSIEQLIPLSIKGCHAGDWNWRSIAVAVCGDFRRNPPANPQYENLINLISLIAPMNGGLEVVGHTDVPSAHLDPNKVCPGHYLNAKIALAKAILIMPEKWREIPEDEVNKRMIEAGIIL